MRKRTNIKSIIRFRRWSRKKYAAFVSMGRCVTIGCLRKNVADSSLSKQKVKGTAGHAGCFDMEEDVRRDTYRSPEAEADVRRLLLISEGVCLQTCVAGKANAYIPGDNHRGANSRNSFRGFVLFYA